MNYHLSMGMNIDNIGARKFILTRKNQKGQVAIFVALIFQVIFVFFALLINVGLLVHHKINLQHSADLAAYYGAMKQAEGMNAIAHVNFQIKQAWKLLTWRYRVLGTFGFARDGTDPIGSQHFPFEYNTASNQFEYYGSMGVSTINANGSPAMKCPAVTLPDGTALGVQDIPFFCVGHDGFSSWPIGESHCQLGCGGFVKAREITTIPNVGNANTPFGGNVAGAINNAIDSVNNTLTDRCLALGPTGAIYLGRFLLAYRNEITTRIRTIEMLAKDLSLDADKVLDIEGKSIFKGSENTFKNNLTGANFAGLSGGSFQAYNGLSNDKCKFRDGLSNNTEFLKKIEFDFINYFIHNCTKNPGLLYLPEPVYTATGLSAVFDRSPQEIKDVMLSFFTPGQKHTVGYEKNPHCVEYYAVKATSEPNIPFLPLAKIKLKATAVAKPFGGTIGPWYGKSWPIGSPASVYQPGNQATQVDETLPERKFSGAGTVKEIVYTLPNFSNYVGDKLGSRDLDYIAAFHSMLQIRDIATYGSKNYSVNKNNLGKQGHPQPVPNPPTPRYWPSANDWDGLGAGPADFKSYDSLATANDDSGVRAIEISAISPNQFDILHYSIDPDFYNNYYVKLYKGFDNITNAIGGIGGFNKDQLRADFGAVSMKPNNGDPDVTDPLTDRTFSVKDQIVLKNTVLNVVPSVGTINKPSITYKEILKSQITTQSSLLTGWTFANYSDFNKFPNDPVNNINQTMSFGQCGNEWNNTDQAVNSDRDLDNFRSPMNIDNKLPPVPGNCVTGGRTGYSVKMISPTIVLPGAETPIENEMDPGFFSF